MKKNMLKAICLLSEPRIKVYTVALFKGTLYRSKGIQSMAKTNELQGGENGLFTASAISVHQYFWSFSSFWLVGTFLAEEF